MRELVRVGLVVALLAGGGCAWAQGGAVAVPPTGAVTEAQTSEPATTVASDSNERARPQNYKACRERVAAAKATGKHIDILFVGDSITEAWTGPAWGGYKHGAEIWERFYADRNALNFGVGADRTQHVLYRLDTMDVKDLTPKVVVLMIGTNNNLDPVADIAAGVHAVLMKLETMYPMARIILVSVLPNARATERMADANKLIRQFADGRTVYYLDLAAKMPPNGNSWVGLGPDRLHPDESGYEIWAQTMEPLLHNLLEAPPRVTPAAGPQ